MERWKIIRAVAWLCLAGVFAVVWFAPDNIAVGGSLVLAFISLMIFSIFKKAQDPHVKQAKRNRKAQREAEKQKRVLDDTPVAAEVVSISGKIPGAAVIGAISGGIPGAIVGAHLGRGTVTFAVRYASGRTDYETVNMDSARFEKLAALADEQQ